MTLTRAYFTRITRGGGVTPAVLAPTITSSDTISLNENVALSHTLTADQTVTWAKVGGADTAAFGLATATLSLTAKDYETPSDSGSNNTYVVQVQATNTTTGLTSSIQTITVTVQNVDELPPTGGTDYVFAPLLEDREIYRTTLVTAGDEYIDLQAEVAHPGSPGATAWEIGGADAAKLTALSGGIYAFESSVRASLAGTTLNVTVSATNATGTSATVDLVIHVVADADCRFISWATGADPNNGLTPATAWKRAPGSYGWAGSALGTLTSKYFFYRGNGERHESVMWKTTSGYSALDHVGLVSARGGFIGSGWGGRAIMDGSEVITGWTAVTQEEVFGNANYLNIEKIDLTTQGGAATYAQQLFCGDTFCWPAQSPTPDHLYEFEGPDDATELQGMWRVSQTSSSGTTPRMYSTSTTVVVIVDTRISTLFGAVDPTGWVCSVWVSGNDVKRGIISGYVQGTSTLTVTFSTSTTLNSVSGMCAYSIAHHPLQIVEAGQIAFSADRFTMYAWRPNASETRIARRNRGATPSKSYMTWEGFDWRGYAANDLGSGGSAFSHGASVTTVDLIIRDQIIRHNRPDGGDGAGYYGSGGTLTNPIIERFHFADYNPRGSGIRIGNQVTTGYVGGSAAQVEANAGGKIRHSFADSGSIGRTFIALFKADGIEIVGNLWRDMDSVHGNGISLYDSGSGEGGYTRFCLVQHNFGDNAERCYTVSVSTTADKALARSNTIRRNIFTGALTGYVVALYSGEPDSTLSQNIIMGGPSYVHSGAALYIDDGQRVTIDNNVTAGIDAENTASDAFTLTDNLLTKNLIPSTANGTTRIITGNTVAAGAPFEQWDGTISAAMQTTLGAGRMGVFHSVA